MKNYKLGMGIGILVALASLRNIMESFNSIYSLSFLLGILQVIVSINYINVYRSYILFGCFLVEGLYYAGSIIYLFVVASKAEEMLLGVVVALPICILIGKGLYDISQRMNKKLLASCILSVCAIVLLWCFSTKIVYLDGVIVQKEQETAGYVEIQFKRYNLLFYKHYAKGIVTVRDNDKNILNEYEISNPIYVPNDILYSIFSYYDTGMNRITFGEIYMDRALENLVLETEELKFVKADESFVESVELFTGKFN